MKNKMQTANNSNDNFVDYSDIFEQPYYRINKRILCFIGQWPYQSVLERTVRTILVTLFTFSVLIPQILKMIDSWDNMDIFIECLSPFITNAACTMKLVNCVIYSKKLRKILDEIRTNWKDVRNLQEMKILQLYGEKGRRLTILYMIMINSIVAAWISQPLLPPLMDYFAPLNQSRPHLPLFQTDYKIDPDKYFYYIVLHGSVVCIVGIQVYVSIDTFYMTMAQHACAMIDILRFRLENIIRNDEGLRVTLHSDIREDVSYHEIIPCIKKHKGVIKYIRLMESSCEWCLVLVLGLNMLCMSCTGSRTVAKNTPTQDVIRFGFFTIAQVVHLFCNTLPGQWIIDSSCLIPDSAFNSKWYLMSLRSRQLITLLIRRSIKPCTITAGKMYVMSMGNFCSVLQTSMSYFTLLTSMQ